MEMPDPLGPLQHIGEVKNSAISHSGTANTYNIAGNQYNQYAAPGNTWKPPLLLPPRAQSFVGREEESAWLLQQLKTAEDGTMLAVCGPGGMGKTALVAEVLKHLIAHDRWVSCFPDGIFYHSFYASPSLDAAYEELARVFGGEPGGSPHFAARRAVSARRALLVFDGVEGLDDTRPLRELGGKNVVLVLSRRRSDAPDQAHRRDLELLSQEEAITLVQTLASAYAADRSCVEQLVQHIGGYPLALQLIGSYLSSRQEEVREYLAWFEREGVASIDFGKRQDQSVVVLLRRTYESLAPDEQEIFLLQGLLAPAPFPVELVQGILDRPERALRQALGVLVNVSVLRRVGPNYEVSHPLIHAFATNALSSRVQNVSISCVTPDVLMRWRERLLNMLTAHFEQSDSYDRAGLVLWSPHVFLFVSVEEMAAEQSLHAARLFNAVGVDAFMQGKYAEAEPLYERALVIHEQQLGAQHPSTATSLNNLAALYKSQGKYALAELLYERALAIDENVYGLEHPEVATDLNNLAGLYESQGKYALAEPLYERARAIREQQLGAQHPDTASSLNNLAVLYRSQGKYAEAEPLYERALAIREQQLGAQHPQTATSLNNLAALYYSQGKYALVEPLLGRALAIREQQLGAQHPDTASSLNNLALLYESQGKYALAEPLYERALAIREQQLGAQHPDTATSLNNLAGLYESQGKHALVEPLLGRALAIHEQQLGAQHPQTQTVRANYASLLQAMTQAGDSPSS